MISPSTFQELENFEGASDLVVFRCLEKEAINYETNALHISAHMFFERNEVKHAFNLILQDFAFKSGANKKVLKLCTTLNKKIQKEIISDNSSFEMGFVDKFVEVFRLRNKLNKISAEITEKNWSLRWSFMGGYELYNKMVLYANPMFEKLLKPVMEKKPSKTELKALCL